MGTIFFQQWPFDDVPKLFLKSKNHDMLGESVYLVAFGVHSILLSCYF